METNFSELDFGPLDSNDDMNISEYFVKDTNDFSQLIYKKTFFVFGAKGVGKTAIKKYLSETRLKNNQPVIVFDNNNIINISELKNISNADLRGRFTGFFVAIILSQLVKKDWVSDEKKKELKGLEDSVPIVKRLLTPLNLKTNFFEYPIKELFSPENKSINTNIFDKTVVDRISEVLDSKDVWLLIDDVDTIFDSDDTVIVDKSIENLIYSVSDLNIQIFKGKINIILFLKSEVWERIYRKSVELDKESQYFLTIRWTNDHLKELLAERIKFATKIAQTKPVWWWWGVICNNLKKSEVEIIQNYILERVINGPRDLLLIIELCQKYAKSKGYSYLELSHVKEIEFNYGREKMTHIARNFQITYPDIDKVIELLFRNSPSTYLCNDLQKIITSKLLTNKDARESFNSLPWVRTLTSYNFIEVLYKVGFLGYFDSSQKKYIYSIEKSNADCSFNNVTLMIHKAFHNYLSLI